MSREVAFDHLIREALRMEEQEQGPAPDVREALLVEAARQQANRLPIQESIPPLAQGLQDEAVGERGETVHWWESERSLFENFSLWDNPWRNPGLAHILVYQETSRCRMNGAAC